MLLKSICFPLNCMYCFDTDKFLLHVVTKRMVVFKHVKCTKISINYVFWSSQHNMSREVPTNATVFKLSTEDSQLTCLHLFSFIQISAYFSHS